MDREGSETCLNYTPFFRKLKNLERRRCANKDKVGKIIQGKMIGSESEPPRLKRRGFTMLTAEHIHRTDMDCIVMMSFLKCLAGGLRHFLEL
jgi:hypothetical protein